jgi:hypothetical protein
VTLRHTFVVAARDEQRLRPEAIGQRRSRVEPKIASVQLKRFVERAAAE